MGREASSAYPHATWRLIIDGEAGGATNMAVDEAILNSVIDGASLPTLRFYAWSPPCLSLGRSQRLAEADLAACRAALFAQMVDDTSAHLDKFPTEEDQARERERLFDIIRELVKWENINNETVLEAAHREICIMV